MSVNPMASSYSLVEAQYSSFQVLMLNCDTLLLDPETLGLEETASAVKDQGRNLCL